MTTKLVYFDTNSIMLTMSSEKIEKMIKHQNNTYELIYEIEIEIPRHVVGKKNYSFIYGKKKE